MVTIAHISDLHVGSPHFVPNLMDRVIREINELEPDLVVGTGDFTNDGFLQEYKSASAYLQQIGPRLVAVPGNHDARNVGYMHFEELIGTRHWSIEVGGVKLVGADSSEPDLDHGQIGRERYPWIVEQFSGDHELKIYVQHHHLLPIPGTGRERNIVYDAGDLLEVLIRCGVKLALTGHKHVPYVWRIENLFVANAGTCASLRLRGHTRPCYNIITVEDSEVTIRRKYPFGTDSVIAQFNVKTGEEGYREFHSVIHKSEPDSFQAP